MYPLAIQKVVVLAKALTRRRRVRKFHQSTRSSRNQHICGDDHCNIKPNVWHYFSKAEVYSLFLQPLGIIIVYLAVVWQLLKYYCNIKDVDQLVDTLKWIRNRQRSND